MKFVKLPVIAASVALSIMACSDDNGSNPVPTGEDPISAQNPAGNEFSGTEIPGTEIPGTEIPGNQIPGNENPGYENPNNQIPGNENPGSQIPGTENPGNQNPGNENPGTQIPGSDVSSSSTTIPGGDAPVLSSSSVGGTNPNPGSEAGDDENDNEDSRTLDGTQILLKLSGTSATVENNNGCVDIADKSATITCPGAYYVTGESSDFQVVVNTPAAEKEGNTGIYLHNATLKSSNAPILVKNADKTVIHLVKGTTNVVEDGNGNHLFTKINGAQDTAKAAIYSRDDLNIKGAGTLTVKGKFRNGIQCSNDLKIKNGNITVEAEENAVKGKGSLQISGGTLNLTAKKGDGLESDECEEVNGECKNIVEGKQIRSLGASARKTITPDVSCIDVLSCAKVIHGATVVPEDLCLQTCAQQVVGRSQQRVLGSHATRQVASCPIDELLHFALAYGIDHEHGNAIACHLDGCARTIALALQSMAAHLDTGREFLRLTADGQIKVGRNIVMRMTFENNLFDHKAVALHRADHAAMQVTPFGKIASQLSHLLAHSGNVCLHVGLRSISLLQLLAALVVALVLPKHQVVEPRLRTTELQGAIVRTTGISDKVIICLGKEACRKQTNCKTQQYCTKTAVYRMMFHNAEISTVTVISCVLSNPVSKRSRRSVSSQFQSVKVRPLTMTEAGFASR